MEKVIYHKDYEDNPDDYIFVDLKNIRSILKEKIIGIMIRDEDIFRYKGLMIVNNVTDKEISGDVIMKAVSNVYKDGYGFEDEEIMKMIPKVIDDNVKKQKLVFPKRYKIDEYGNKKVIMNEKNKFDIEYKGRSR